MHITRVSWATRTRVYVNAPLYGACKRTQQRMSAKRNAEKEHVTV